MPDDVKDAASTTTSDQTQDRSSSSASQGTSQAPATGSSDGARKVEKVAGKDADAAVGATRSDAAKADAAKPDADKGDAAKTGAKAAEGDAAGKTKDQADGAAALEFDYPKGLGEVLPENDQAFRELASKHKWTKEAVEDVLSFAAGVLGPEKAAEMQQQAAAEAKVEMLAELKEEHGKAYDERAGKVRALVERYGGESVVDWLDETGGSAAKPLFNLLYAISKDLESGRGRTEPTNQERGQGRQLLTPNSGHVFNYPSLQKKKEA